MQYPLEGFRIVDFGWVAAAPILGSLLADMGAEIIKVETRKRPDTSRYSPDNTIRDPERDPWFHCMNRGKLGITVDMTQPRGLTLLKELIKLSDAVVENFSPRVLKRYDLDYNSLRELKPDIVMLSLSSAGQFGPMSNVVTYGPSLNGIAGVDSLVGYCREHVLGMQQAYADFIAAIHGAFALLAALYHHKNTGEGQYIDMAQLEALISVFPQAFMEYFMNDRVIGTLGNRHPTMAPHNNYRCKGEDKWISVAVNSEEEWKALCQALDEPSWTDQKRFADKYSRWTNQEELDKLLSYWTINHTDYEAMDVLQKAGVAAAPCMDAEERYFDTHFQEREVYTEITHPRSGTFVITNTPWKMSKSPNKIRVGAPMYGEHNDYVFGELLGLPQAEIARLIEEKVLY
ncbi:MAG: CoA transferase [Chloroflexota bacterium]|nr:CoA transferase [Chloroflexota bacterium]